MGVFLSKGSELLVTPERHASVQQIGGVYAKRDGRYVAVFSSPLWNLTSKGKCERPVAMSGFHLVPVDGGCPLPLPLGETVIGRGSFLGVSATAIRQRSASLCSMFV